MNRTASYDRLRPRTFFMGAAAQNPEDSDYALARAAAGGAIAAFGDLYARHNRRVYSLCLRMTRNIADAEDLTQEVFILLFRKIGSFRGESQFVTWLHRLTVNHVLMHFRRLSVRKEQLHDDIEVEVLIPQKSTPSAAMRVVDRIALDAALAQLPPGCRSVFVLFDIEGYKHGEIARMLGCSTGNSKSQLHKARMKLRRLLKSGRSKRE
jgi:RNA polymerase sigma-70 factor (ECF subfamily)